MCRALLYLGKPVLLDNLLFQPDSALVRQSYMPKMLHMMNLAGFGMRAWDAASHDPASPFSYASDSLPIFDRNLKNLAGKVSAGCVLAHVRGVAYTTQVEISLQNVHPFQFPGVPLTLAHNGDLARFAEMRPGLTRHVRPDLARCIRGTTDSEWIYALAVSQLEAPHVPPTGTQLVAAMKKSMALIREERAQPYLWRFWRQIPGHGHAVIFDRSWYGRVLVERVEKFASEPDWMRAYGEINEFEEQLAESGAIVAKFWLSITPAEQLRRFKARQDTVYKRFKITDEDWRNRKKWPQYERAVNDMIERTSTEPAPWSVIASDDKLFARVETLERLCDRIEEAL